MPGVFASEEYESAGGKILRMAIELEADDRALARRLLAGDEAAFEAFFEGHFPGLYRFAVARVKDPELARDLVQSAICKAIANLRSYRGEATLAAWLFTICRYEIRGYYRKLGRAPAPHEQTAEVPEVRSALANQSSDRDGPEEDLSRKQVACQVYAVLDRLPPRQASALEWKYLDGLSVKEIAARLAVGAKAAESLLSRGRQAFRDLFKSLAEE